MTKNNQNRTKPARIKGCSTESINKQSSRYRDNDVIWLFGYGSLIFKADFPYLERLPASIQGWERRFWQGSHDHRGTTELPGRVVTLIKSDNAICHGMAYQITADNLNHLDYREKNGYRRFNAVLTFENKSKTEGLVYIATENNVAFLGPVSEKDIARQIATSVGPSGANADYLLNLAAALREIRAVDKHVFEVEKQLIDLQATSSSRK